MTASRLSAVLAPALLAHVLASGGIAQEPAGIKGNSKATTSKGEDRSPAMTINFPKALGLPFDSLMTLGTRIEQALKVSDPVCLVGLAKELSACEQVSGKTAGLTSETLYKQAIALVEVRNIPAELKAVAQYVKDDETAKKLGKLAEAAERREVEGRRTFEAGERTRGITQNLIVHNNTGFQIFIYHDGRQLGWVNPYDNFTFFVGAAPGQNSVVVGRSADGSKNWGPTAIDQVYTNFDWVLN